MKQVPLTVIVNGVRHVIGMVIVEKNGDIASKVNKDSWGFVKDLLEPGKGEFQIVPTPHPTTFEKLLTTSSVHHTPKHKE